MTDYCKTCVHYPPSSCDGKPCTQCEPEIVLFSCYQKREEEHKQTNADRIRAMTDEELAMVITQTNYISPPWCADYNEPCRFIEEDHTPCEVCALDWLKKEA